MTIKEFKQRFENGEVLNFIDIREEWEYEEKNIGAINIPFPDLPHRLDEISELKNKEIILHCGSGVRSLQAKLFLESQGFTNVHSLEGGIEGFIEKE
jgi:rhodanese-related sulfurtransferase